VQQVSGSAEALVGHVLDVTLAAVDRRHEAWIRVHADHFVSLCGEGQGQGKTYVAQADHADLHGFGSARVTGPGV